MTRIVDTAAAAHSEVVRLPDAPALPCRLGAWQLVRLMAEGEMSRLYQARPAESQGSQPALYAVKLLRRRWHDSPEATEGMRRAAMLGRSVSHPHLISVLAAHVNGPPYYIVMPWLNGTTLAAQSGASPRNVSELAEQTATLPALGVSLWLVRQVAEALAALHADGWMHADIKPGNVLVSPTQHATLLDLGFARRPEESDGVPERMVLGTIHYIAPEMITSVWGADIRSDIYSLGVMLYELLTGRLPFPGDQLGDVVRAHRQAQPPCLRRLAPHVPKEVARLVHQMLAKDPLRRPQTPRELIDRLVPLEIGTLAERF